MKITIELPQEWSASEAWAWLARVSQVIENLDHNDEVHFAHAQGVNKPPTNPPNAALPIDGSVYTTNEGLKYG